MAFLPAAPPQFYTEFHDSAVYCFPRWKYGNLSPAKNAVGGPDYLLLGTIPPCLASGSASCGQTTHKKLPQMYQPQPEQKGLKTIVRTDFRKTFPSSPQTGQRMSQNSKKSKTSVEKVLHLLVSYTLFPAPSPFSSRSCGGEWNQEFPHPFPPEQSLKICLSYCRSGITPVSPIHFI